MTAATARTLLWAAAAVVTACAAPATRRGGPDIIDAPAEPLPTIGLELEVSGHAIRAIAAHGPMCDGEVTGAITVTTPGRRTDRLEVRAPTAETRCVGCDPYPGAPPDVCNNACQRQFLNQVELARYDFDIPGEYTISGSELALSCAPGRAMVKGATFTVPGRPAVADPTPPDAAPAVIVVPPIDAAAAARPTTTGIHGAVVVSHDAIESTPIAGHRIVIRSAAGKTIKVKTGGDGTYAVALAPGRYTVKTTVPKFRHAIAGDTTATVDVVAGTSLQLDFRFSDGTRCLDAATPIATPRGAIPADELVPGDEVWSCAADGRAVRDRVIATQVVDAPGAAMRLELADGRTLIIAPSHPLATGQRPADLAPGDRMAGEVIVGIRRVGYDHARSFDLQTASGRPYWASGVAMWSTMAPPGEPIACSAP